jgi:8-amino-7-oxononanoate synthase
MSTSAGIEDKQPAAGVNLSASAPWMDALQDRIDTQRRLQLHRTCKSAPVGLVDLSSNDYLGLRQHPQLIEAVARAARDLGVGSGASRLVGGSSGLHSRVEARSASFKHAEAALILPTGYMANLAVLTSLPSPGDLIAIDRLNHASLMDGGQLAAARGVKLRRFHHRDAEHARRLAHRHLTKHPDTTIWLVSDSVFSMDGDLAPIAQLAQLRDELNAASAGGCCLILDEAHATGVLGATGAGADELAGRVADLCISTASKALGSLGGIITGRQIAIDAIVNFARPMIYTTAVPPTQVAAIDAALEVLRDEPSRRARLCELSGRLRHALIDNGWPAQSLGHASTPIIPIVVGEAESAVELSQHLARARFYAPAIRPPTVPAGAARVRLSVTATLTDEELSRLVDALPMYHGRDVFT